MATCISVPIPDANTGLEALAAAQTAKTFLGPVAERVLGPTADYLGEGLKSWTHRQRENVGRIFDKADARLTDKQRHQGAVPPRVLKAVLDEGSFCDDELAVSYFGGVLASSRSEVDRDDRGATLAALVGRLSTYEIRAHYVLYAYAQRRLAGLAFNMGMGNERSDQAQLFLPVTTWIDGMDFSPKELVMLGDILSDTLSGLRREDLIEEPWGYGDPQMLRTDLGMPATVPGIVVQLSTLGTRLFVWAHGASTASLTYFLDTNADFSMTEMPPLTGAAFTRADLARQASGEPPTTEPS
jgi:hypothetical protein